MTDPSIRDDVSPDSGRKKAGKQLLGYLYGCGSVVLGALPLVGWGLMVVSRQMHVKFPLLEDAFYFMFTLPFLTILLAVVGIALGIVSVVKNVRVLGILGIAFNVVAIQIFLVMLMLMAGLDGHMGPRPGAT